jgi:glycosyltransferase involved in cell wall biosynthesis
VPEQIPSVLHILPHPGGGGEKYVDSLNQIQGYRFERVYLAKKRAAPAAIPGLVSSVPSVTAMARRFDIVHMHGEIPSFLSLPALARKPSVVTLHGLSFVRRSTGIAAKVATANLRMIVGAATRLICVSEAEFDEVTHIVGAASAHKLVHVPLGVEVRPLLRPDERAESRSALGLSGEMAVALVGVLEYPKDPVTAARAVVEVARSGVSIILLIAGEGSLRAQLEKVAGESDGTVRLLGHRDDVSRLLAASDAFLLSSLHEGLPYALLEAMAEGLPVIVTDYPGAEEAVDDAGVIVPPSDVLTLAETLQNLAHDPAKRALLGESARARAISVFSLDTMIERTQQIYDELVESR